MDNFGSFVFFFLLYTLKYKIQRGLRALTTFQ